MTAYPGPPHGSAGRSTRPWQRHELGEIRLIPGVPLLCAGGITEIQLDGINHTRSPHHKHRQGLHPLIALHTSRTWPVSSPLACVHTSRLLHRTFRSRYAVLGAAEYRVARHCPSRRFNYTNGDASVTAYDIRRGIALPQATGAAWRSHERLPHPILHRFASDTSAYFAGDASLADLFCANSRTHADRQHDLCSTTAMRPNKRI